MKNFIYTLVILLILSLSATLFASDTLYTITATKVRNSPDVESKSNITGKLFAGTRLENAKINGEWVSFKHKNKTAYVHSKCTGDCFYPPPILKKLVKERRKRWILSYNPSNKMVASLSYENEGEEVFYIYIINCRSGHQLDAIVFGVPYGTSEKQKFIDYVWNDNGIEIQTLMKKYGFKTWIPGKDNPLKKISINDMGLEVGMGYPKKIKSDKKSITSLKYKGMPLINIKDYYSESRHTLQIQPPLIAFGDDYYRVNLKINQPGGCPYYKSFTLATEN